MAKGKLYISGEYAVVDGGAAVIAAVNRSLTCRIVPGADERLEVNLAQFPSFSVDDENRYVKAAVYVAARFMNEVKDRLPDGASLDIHSELVESDGRKYGLGSSGAVTVAVIEALLAQYELSRLDIYKLAVLALLLVGDNGSFGDIACSSFGQMIYYVRPSHKFLQNLQEQMQDVRVSVHSILQLHWDGLQVEPLTLPKGLMFKIGWTGNPASSAELVESVRGFKQDYADEYANFCKHISAVSEQIQASCAHDDAGEFLQAYCEASLLMTEFSVQSGGFAETEKLRTLKEIAQQYGCEAKFSGAGGGDCGIAVGLQDQADFTKLKEAWESNGIMDMNWELF